VFRTVVAGPTARRAFPGIAQSAFTHRVKQSRFPEEWQVLVGTRRLLLLISCVKEGEVCHSCKTGEKCKSGLCAEFSDGRTRCANYSGDTSCYQGDPVHTRSAPAYRSSSMCADSSSCRRAKRG
jgi:hypothetical protein